MICKTVDGEDEIMCGLQYFSLLLMILQLSSAQGSENAASSNLKEEQPEVHCSRERSRAAWKIIEEYLMPFVEKEKYQLSSRCRLHPSNDIFRDQEEHKIHVDINEWRCGYCKKIFRAEKYLDQHFDNRHNNLLNVENRSGENDQREKEIASVAIELSLWIAVTNISYVSHGKCLADLCGALHCDFVINSQSHKTKCNPPAAARNRHLCEDLADSCFPVKEGSSATRLHEFFLRQFCDAHSCSRGRKPFSRGGRKHTSVFYLATSVLILMFLPIFYLIVYLYQREMRTGKTQLKRISKPGRKPKPS
ncbi:hypothetical protein DH2020_019061 [Rehmannia glutinosa]|uniref:C2H2-type domain-containing protein n=1 Tax=Rehmannia glutinosa TaxID=99300 RepID=A0ABR0WM41_REHGL